MKKMFEEPIIELIAYYATPVMNEESNPDNWGEPDWD